jgi:hypothetical protein
MPVGVSLELASSETTMNSHERRPCRPNRCLLGWALISLLLGGWGERRSLAQADQPPGVVGQSIVGDPADAFLNPPEYAKPGVLWMWMGYNLSKEGMTRDLEALKAAGFNRTTMFSLADVVMPWSGMIEKSPTPQMVAWTEPWWQVVRHAALESKRLGLDFGIHNCPGYESSGGKWITAEHSMQMICQSEVLLYGGKPVTLVLPKPQVNLEAAYPDFYFPMHNPQTKKVEIPIVAERGTYYCDIVVLAAPADGEVNAAAVVDLTGKMEANGRIELNLPVGKWRVYRFGHTTKGVSVQPAQWEAAGFECDKMSREAVGFHLDHVVGDIRKHLGDLIGTGISHVHFDSYEAGAPTWTPKMRAEFLKYRSYDLTPYLLTFAGRTVGSKERTETFKRDFEDTIKDLYRDVYFTIIRDKLHAAGLEFQCEPYGGSGLWRMDEVMPKIDRVMTEFWTTKGQYRPYQVDETIAAVRKSGQNLIEAEAFTGEPIDSSWTEYPEWFKPIGDAGFCAGINRMVMHRFVHQPWDDRYRPGQAMGQHGSHFDRTQTWWEPGKALFQYWHRTQALLLWGKYATEPGDFELLPAQANAPVKAIRRGLGETDVLFVANLERTPTQGTCAFAITGKQPELWDPVTSEIRDLPDFEIKDGRTLVPMEFASAQSYFIVFRKKTAPNQTRLAGANTPSYASVREVAGPWQVSFDHQWGGPKQAVKFNTLTDWTRNENPGIKYYSGTAVYRTTFSAPAGIAGRSAALDLGKVLYIARVKLNGRDLGVVWCAPWKITIPRGVLRESDNELEIEITNVWANRLIGDDLEPDDCVWLHPDPAQIPLHEKDQYLKEFPDWFLKGQPRPSKGRYCFTTWNYDTKTLMPSGLLGPVRLRVPGFP